MLETVLLGSLLGREVVAKSISEITNKTYSNISILLNNDTFIFKEILEELDIKVKIQVIDKLISDLDNNKNLSEPIHVCLINLHNIIEKINDEILEINKKNEEYEKVWLKMIYTNPACKLIENLKKHTRIMDARLDMLVKLLTVS